MPGGEHIRVILRTIQIHNALEPAWEDEGEFRFRVKVSGRSGIVAETTLPSEDSYYSASDHPARNRLYLNKVLFDGEIDDHLEVEIVGEEIDAVSANEELGRYHRVWDGSPSAWIGYYHPGDEGSTDPERMQNWGVSLEIERVSG
jgi:hypothetical protein